MYIYINIFKFFFEGVKMNVIDLFSGGGGLTEGFLRQGFNTVAHVEMDTHACSTLRTRLFYHILKENKIDDYYAYLKEEITLDQLFEDNCEILNLPTSTVINQEINQDSENNIIKQIKELIAIQDISHIEGIIGGPPCQAYSCAGRGRAYENMKNDSRNYLYKHYLSFLKEFNPDFFVFENVPGMLSAKTDIEIFPDFERNVKKLGYNINYELLYANKFKVLQKRKRLIVIGHKDSKKYLDFEFDNGKKFKVWDVLKDLPKLNPGEGNDSPVAYTNKISRYLKETNIRTKKDVVINHAARNHNENDREIYRLVIKAWNNNHQRIRYDELPKELTTHKNKKSFLDRFKIVAGDLEYSHTIMAHLSKDGHYFIHPDIDQARSITVREAARLQSFPDNYKFEGPRTSQFKQVGNAVPPLMAERIAQNITNVL